MNIFEEASRTAIRFTTIKGLASTEDLWAIPLQATGLDLDDIWRDLKVQVRRAEETESLITGSQPENSELQLKLDIVTHIIEIKLAARKKSKTAAATRAKNDKIREIIHNKQNAELLDKDISELKAMLED